MIVYIVILALLFLLPFVPGICELMKKEDAEPLYINMDYCKNPRYFGLSFRKVFLDSLKEYPNARGLRLINLSRQETAEVVTDITAADGSVLQRVYYIQNDLKSGKKVMFEKELFARGNAIIGEDNQLRALACDKDVHILSGTKLIRWLDAEGSITVEEKVDLGISATCSKELSLAPKCSFRRIYGMPIKTGFRSKPIEDFDQVCGVDIAIREAAATSQLKDQRERNKIVFEGKPEHNLFHIDPYSWIDRSIVAHRSLNIGAYSLIRGHIKAHGNLLIERRGIITGNVFAEGDIVLGPHCWILGSVFTQGNVVLEDGVKIGSREEIKSVVSKKGITLHSGVKIYGFVSTEGEGRVL